MRNYLEMPEIWIATNGFLLAFLWEMLQMPVYDMGGLSTWQATKNCAFATFGDAGIMVFAYWVATRFAPDRLWLRQWHVRLLATYLSVGMLVTIVVEHFALRSDWGWTYSETMPTIATIGLVPILMWLIVPMVTLAMARRSLFGGKADSGD
ncbi:hypothetical protein A9995_10405 [Erythrobacter sp. QSSC1-22B]|uniref:hypothetical protein n=1 Tax=Erythrobacter sp. QSSC1-22B TaxID=1860125 RepID=UPI000805591F|nr:hypothetical protein [Erythrobacter sp. QSSC1-22B]OBX18942.1 hypothetical protein A9995_10405 [Erythrobacter sp. QSSC1-22B]